MAATRPTSEQRVSRRAIAVAFGVALLAVALLVTVPLLLRHHGSSSSQVTPPLSLQGIDQAGPVLGNPKAKVTLIEYADLQCPGCDYYTVNVWPTLLDDYVRTGKVKNEFRGIAFLGSDSLKALRFVFAAGLQNRLWEFEDGLYRNQGKENSGWVTDDLLRNVAAQIPGLDVEKLFADANGGEVQQMIGQAEAQANAAGVSSTPTLFVQIGGRKPYRLVTAFDVGQLRAALDDALKG